MGSGHSHVANFEQYSQTGCGALEKCIRVGDKVVFHKKHEFVEKVLSIQELSNATTPSQGIDWRTKGAVPAVTNLA